MKPTSSWKSFEQLATANTKAHAYLLGIRCAFNNLWVLSINDLRTNVEESWNIKNKKNITCQKQGGRSNWLIMDEWINFKMQYKTSAVVGFPEEGKK